MTSLTRPAPRPARRESATHGAALTFETLVEGQAAHARLRMHDDTLLRVIAGIVRVTIEAEAHWLQTGDEIVIPAGASHRLASAGGVARLVTGLARGPRAERVDEVAPARAHALERPAEAAARVEVLRRAQHREQGLRDELGVDVRRRLAQQDREVRGVERVRAAVDDAPGRLGDDEQLDVALERGRSSPRRTRAGALRRGRPARAAAGRRSARPGTRACARRAAPARARRGRRSGGTASRCRRTPRARRRPSRRARCRAPRPARSPPPGCAGGCGRRPRARAASGRRRTAGARARRPSCRFRHADCSTGDPTSRTRSPRTSSSRAAELGVGERVVGVEGRVGHADRQLGLEHVRARGLERLADLGLRPDGAEQAGAGPDHGARLLAQDVVGERARGPVERVLEPAGDRGVVLGRGDQEPVGLRRPRRGSPRRRAAASPRGPRRRWAGRRGPPTPRSRLRAGACRPPPGAAVGCGSPGAHCLRCRGSASATPAATSESSTVRVTSLASTLPPDGSGHVPVHVELGAVDDGLEVEVAAGVAERVGGGRDPRAGRLDRARDALDRQLAGDGRGAVLAQVEVVGGEA